MIIFYARPTCPYCAKVRTCFQDNGVIFDERNIGDQEHHDALMSLGGKKQVPFIIDEENNVMMYESDDIIRYIEEKLKA